MYSKFRDIYEARHERAKSFPGRGVIGYICTLVPEEIIYAAGFLPVRVVGGHEPQTVSDTHIPSIFCSYCRDILAQGLKGHYKYLKGLVHTNGCEKIRSALDSWGRHVPEQKIYFIWMPQVVTNKGSKEAFLDQIRWFKQQLEEDQQVTITDDELARTIEIYNENRRLMKQVYELTKEVPSRISGEELVSMVCANQVMDKAEHSQLVREFLKEVETRKKDDEEVRVMIVGETSGDLQLFQLLDSLGAKVVADESCFGMRYFWDEIDTDGDPLEAIAARYVERFPCPVKDGAVPRRRVPIIMDIVKEYQVELVLLVNPAFCDPHGYDNAVIRPALLDEGIKVLELGMDFPLPVGQISTRIEATLETINLI